MKMRMNQNEKCGTTEIKRRKNVIKMIVTREAKITQNDNNYSNANSQNNFFLPHINNNHQNNNNNYINNHNYINNNHKNNNNNNNNQ